MGEIYIDLSLGAFNNNIILEKDDFQAPATYKNTSIMSRNGTVAETEINAEQLNAIHNYDSLQFRLHFSSSNLNNTKDILSYYSGSASTPDNNPTLTLEYTLPD